MKKQITNWGNYPSVICEELSFTTNSEAQQILKKAGHIAPRGNGRCYGDASLGENIMSTTRFNKVLAFDVDKGVFTCQAGITLAEVLNIIVPKKWFLSVTP